MGHVARRRLSLITSLILMLQARRMQPEEDFAPDALCPDILCNQPDYSEKSLCGMEYQLENSSVFTFNNRKVMNYLEIIGIHFINTVRKTLLLTHRYPLLCTALAWLTFLFSN